jgi:3-methyl-2-oxobutanoate hydroxymethyltransferase
MKRNGERIPCVTAYDYPTAHIADDIGIPLLLVGDSLGNVVLGYESTVQVTLDEILHHTKAVVRGSSKAMVVADMPFMTFQVSPQEALRNAGRLLQEGGAQAVKVEGGHRTAETVRCLVEAGIPVMGHLGLTPQSVNQFGGYRVQGRSHEDTARLVEDAKELEQAGVFAVVLEAIPAELAAVVTHQLEIPTIGIGAGVHCDGEVQVLYEMLGLITSRPRKHANLYADLNAVIRGALETYVNEVQECTFPAEEHSHHLEPDVLACLQRQYPAKR